MERLGCFLHDGGRKRDFCDFSVKNTAADLIFSYLAQLLMAGEQAPLAPGGIIYFDALKLFSRFDIYEEVRHGKIVK